MTECDNENLIDLNINNEEDCIHPSILPQQQNVKTSSDVLLPNCLKAVPLHKRDSFDNNPFDCIQKLANKLSDPFDIVENEATTKALMTQWPQREVKIANLLSLSDDNLESGVNDSNENFSDANAANQQIPIFGSDDTLRSVGSTIYNSPKELATESPPLQVSTQWTPDSVTESPIDCNEKISHCDSGVPNSFINDTPSTSSTKSTSKSSDYRTRLLKLSLTNSTFNSPLNRQNSEENFYHLSQTIECATSNEAMISAESPLKLIEDDLMYEEPPIFADITANEFENDLKLLKIPILEELPSSQKENVKFIHKLNKNIEDEKKNVEFEETKFDQSVTSGTNNTSTLSALPNLETLRAKLRSRRDESNNCVNIKNKNIDDMKDVPFLIENLKCIIADIDVVDDHKKNQVNSLLENLCSVLVSEKTGSKESINENIVTPQPMIRQGTFDMDLKENEISDHEELNGGDDDNNKMLQPMQPANIEDMPDTMFKSSATYDGDPIEERDFVLPKIESELPTQVADNQVKTNGLIEKLTRLLDQHQSTQISDSTVNGQALNPTFIVVMNPQQNQLASIQNALEQSFHDDRGDNCTYGNSTMRRRSHSLSIHDKGKIVQLTVNSGRNENENTTPPSQPQLHEFKTPSRFMMRRNSFSNATPRTPIISTPKNYHSSRRSSVFEYQHPMHLPQASSITSFKTDLKKKNKTASESIMKSSAPLKATIPLKKVVPMLRCTPLTNDICEKDMDSASKNYCANTSLHLLTKSGRISNTSTPMPLSRSDNLGIPAGYPNACSTPSILQNGNAVRTRSSYCGSTPSEKLQNNGTGSMVSTLGLKRRIMNELKTKSPIKPRVNCGNGSVVTSNAKQTTRNLNSGTTLRNGINKQQPLSITNKGPMSSRIRSRSPAVVTKSKENKHP